MNLYPFPEFLLKIAAALLVFISPIGNIMMAVSLLLIADCVTGTAASLKKGEKFSSHKFFNSIIKMIFYLILIMVSHLVQVHLVNEIPFTQLAIYMVVVYEFSSLAENVGIITGRDVFAFFRDALGRLKKK